VPIVWQVVDSGTPAPARIAMMALLRRIADAAMFNGQALADMHVNGRPLEAPSVVYYPPVDTVKFVESAERRAATRASLGIPASAPVVGMVANLNPHKGIEYFVRAAAILHSARPDVWFVLVGARDANHVDYLARIEAEAATLGIPKERLILTGARADVENMYPCMDVKLITSARNEGTTTTGMEAAACGVPVVATDVGAVREVVTDNVTGMIVPLCDAVALASATLRLLNDAELRRQMGQAGRRQAVERFDIAKCAQLHAEAFEMAIAHRALRGNGPPGRIKDAEKLDASSKIA
jgi:glycosyltransferase involved in cell wall biosynthesis